MIREDHSCLILHMHFYMYEHVLIAYEINQKQTFRNLETKRYQKTTSKFLTISKRLVSKSQIMQQCIVVSEQGW